MRASAFPRQQLVQIVSKACAGSRQILDPIERQKADLHIFEGRRLAVVEVAADAIDAQTASRTTDVTQRVLKW